MDLWLSFLNFSKRHQTLEEVLRSYGRALDVLGSDWRAWSRDAQDLCKTFEFTCRAACCCLACVSEAAPIWSDYLALLKHAYNVQQKRDACLIA